ncbi:protein of unknown function [Candidatus Nitrotoga arctica]|uniref:Uncharacterized protein n=1 Tax=Candidatus Nitrotoga arctica TaxID=453162 RepID=A0ABM8Z365_9PROT|nr:protein of unknown function [Candidatus Nitrotoga arctica]
MRALTQNLARGIMQTRRLLLKAADIEKMSGDRKVHFLNPNAVCINKSLGDAIGLNHWRTYNLRRARKEYNRIL